MNSAAWSDSSSGGRLRRSNGRPHAPTLLRGGGRGGTRSRGGPASARAGAAGCRNAEPNPPRRPHAQGHWRHARLRGHRAVRPRARGRPDGAPGALEHRPPGAHGPVAGIGGRPRPSAPASARSRFAGGGAPGRGDAWPPRDQANAAVGAAGGAGGTRRGSDASPTVYRIRLSPPPNLLQRGLDPIRILDALGELGEVVRVGVDTSRLPPLEALDPERAYLGFDCWLRSAQPRDRIEACFEFVGDPAAVIIEPVDDTAARGLAEPAPLPSEATTIRVATERVDRLVDLVGELVIAHSMMAESVAGLTPERIAELERAVAQMGRHVRTLQDRVMPVRMLPIRVAFGRIQRTIRDLAQALGKQVRLEMSGEETELDKSVIEQISDPLLHLVRNAVDHGIEDPEARRRAGKPEAGRLGLRAYQQGGSIYVEVSDDGRGLDRATILAKAAAAGLLSGKAPLTDEQAFDLIFHPGFSTAERVTEISGRGIGMDVVKRNVGLLGGSIAIQSERGRGATFRLKLPLTLAILDGQTLRVGGETYILPLASIVESVQARCGDFRDLPGGGEVITLRSEAFPVLRLARLFGVIADGDDRSHGLVVIVEDAGRRLGLLADELLNQQQVVIKSLEANFRRLEGIAGATVLGDGRVALIIDVPGLVALGRSALRLREHGAVRLTGGVVEAAR